MSPKLDKPSKDGQAFTETINGKLLESFKLSGLSPKIGNFGEVSSYSWLNSASPKIAIPGLPPRWTPPRSPPHLKQDAGSYFRDQNAARNPDYPMEAAIRSVLWQKIPKVTEKVQIFACGSTLGSLLRFVRQQPKAFAFRVEVIGKTTFFVRKENSPTEFIEGVYGYGHTFPEAYTTWGPSVAASESHQKVIRYSFGGKNMMVRFEADGYLPEKVTDLLKPVETPSTLSASDSGDLSSALEQLQTDSIQVRTGPLEVISVGSSIPQAAIFDLKTRSIKKAQSDVIGEEMQRLWINQIPNFILAFHQRGIFNDIRVQDVRGRVCAWESNHQEDLQMLAGLLDHICKAAAKAVNSRLEVSYTAIRGLQLRNVDDKEIWSVMPEELEQQWLDT